MLIGIYTSILLNIYDDSSILLLLVKLLVNLDDIFIKQEWNSLESSKVNCLSILLAFSTLLTDSLSPIALTKNDEDNFYFLIKVYTFICSTLKVLKFSHSIVKFLLLSSTKEYINGNTFIIFSSALCIYSF